MGKKNKNIVSDGDIVAGRRTITTGGRHIVSDGDMYVVRGRSVSNGKARQCTSCGGTGGWQTTTQDGQSVTVHTGCGAVQ
ncbi:hypothetical protein GCM10010168_15210 [Actinoplanes ianthinogenes]|uniref:Uncharacterized protein n=1 Tax=Actinoplanes ianthinogenes TaxID=122358 RepID=A0ABN6CJ32_9ACTN|nr:hypothetical protein [Actinoplanes ianthinogenes]BCJ44708.1 hypothetical protein Aiant_53650 [Actinoplanes ianthinogenes]GGQ99519.1 hypothetical protein GCM10010168_15210 [Actinoplanes ianthinogenes]